MKIGIILVLIMLLPFASAYQSHGLCFQISDNWSVVKDQTDENETKIVVSDNTSAMRIDIMKKDYLAKLPEGEGYGGHEYTAYRDSVVRAQKHMCLEGDSGSIPIIGGNVDMGVSCDTDLAEWVLLWPSGDKYIGVHALFTASYPITKIRWDTRGAMETNMLMADPLFDLLSSMNFERMNQTTMKRKINCDGSKELDLAGAHPSVDIV